MQNLMLLLNPLLQNLCEKRKINARKFFINIFGSLLLFLLTSKPNAGKAAKNEKRIL
jgi:hypothetical protein